MGGICRRRYYERGAWYEIKCVKETIIGKERDGLDASFERGLLRAWSKCPGWEEAAQALLDTRKQSKSRRVKGKKGGLHRVNALST